MTTSCSAVDVPRIISEEIWTSCLAGVLCNQSLIPISFYSGKDLCTEGKSQLLLYSTRAALPTLPIHGCHKGLTLHHPLKPCHNYNSGDKCKCNCQNNKSFCCSEGVWCKNLMEEVHILFREHWECKSASVLPWRKAVRRLCIMSCKMTVLVLLPDLGQLPLMQL